MGGTMLVCPQEIVEIELLVDIVKKKKYFQKKKSSENAYILWASSEYYR